MEVWKSRDLTYFGKNLIIKSFVLSVIGYEIEMRGIPVKFEKEINSIITSMQLFILFIFSNQIISKSIAYP
jgi:hypothetical protein